jgi:hypothetical protein
MIFPFLPKRRGTPDKAVAVFVKAPRAGYVKTRLARGLGTESAVRFYTLCARHICDRLRSLPDDCARYAYYSGALFRSDIRALCGPGITLRPQADDESLGMRLNCAFEELFRKGMQRVVIVGSDIPDLHEGIILDAFKALETHEVVMGPAHDGGYYLIGLTRPLPALFRNMPWSSSRILQKTEEKCEDRGFSYHTLGRCYDIDTLDDITRWYCSRHEYGPPHIVREVRTMLYMTRDMEKDRA